MDSDISNQYRAKGVEQYYRDEGSEYSNPHEFAIVGLLERAFEKWNFSQLSEFRVLDLACGSGEVTSVVERVGVVAVDGIDPYTFEAYQKRTGRMAEQLNFRDVALGQLDGRCYDIVICSFALHLLDESWLPQLCQALNRISERFVVLTPHKRPRVQSDWGWDLEFEWLQDRVRLRSYCRRRC